MSCITPTPFPQKSPAHCGPPGPQTDRDRPRSTGALTVARLGPEESLSRFAGTVTLDHIDVMQADADTLQALRRNRIGTVFQDPAASLNPLMTVGAQVAETLDDAGDLAARFAEVGLATIPDIATRYPHELSGGQQQRVGIAIALAGDPDLLIADEPTTALDVTVQAQILDLLAELKARRVMAMLFISHDFGVVARLADRIVVMRHGQVVETGPAHQVLKAPSSAYTRALLACRPRLDTPPARLTTLSETPAARPRPPRGECLIEVVGLEVVYPPRGLFGSPVTAAREVSFELYRGEALGLVGESGSGKSTVAKAMIGLAPVSRGSLRYRGTAWEPKALTQAQRRTVQYIFQDSYGSLNPRHKVETLVREGLDLHRVGAAADRDRTVHSLLSEVGLSPELASRYPRELSGGQRQRVAIARALALDPEILICDEIVSALDVSVQAQVLNLLKDLMAQRGLAVLFISHDLAVIRFLSDRIMVMQDGHIVEAAKAEDLVTAPQHAYSEGLITSSRAVELG